MGGFKEFIARGNVIDLAVAVIIGAAFATIVSSLTDDILMPIVGALLGDLDFSSRFIRLGALPAGFDGDPNNYAALKEGGVALLGYGQFITALVNFLILAFIIYQVVKLAARVKKPDADESPAPTDELLVLRDIREELRTRR